jgi:IS5 family transposase
MAAMITPRIKPSAFWRRQPTTDLFVQDQRQAKLGNFIASLAAMDELIDFAAIATEVDRACPRPDRSQGGRPPYPTEVMVRLLFHSVALQPQRRGLRVPGAGPHELPALLPA